MRGIPMSASILCVLVLSVLLPFCTSVQPFIDKNTENKYSLKTLWNDEIEMIAACKDIEETRRDQNPLKTQLLIRSPSSGCLSEIIRSLQEQVSPGKLKKNLFLGSITVVIEYDLEYWDRQRRLSSVSSRLQELQLLVFRHRMAYEEVLDAELWDEQQMRSFFEWSTKQHFRIGINFMSGDVEEFFSIASGIMPVIHSLDFMERGITDEDGLVIARYLEFFPHLTTLGIEESTISGSIAARIVMKLTISNPNLESLRISLIADYISLIQTLASVITDGFFKKLHTLTLENIIWSYKDLTLLTRSLEKSRNLKHLSLGGSVSSDEFELERGQLEISEIEFMNEIIIFVRKQHLLTKLNLPYPCCHHFHADHLMSRIRRYRPYLALTIDHRRKARPKSCSVKAQNSSLRKLVLLKSRFSRF